MRISVGGPKRNAPLASAGAVNAPSGVVTITSPIVNAKPSRRLTHLTLELPHPPRSPPTGHSAPASVDEQPVHTRAMTRSEPSFTAGEKDMLCGWMDFHRATIVMKLDGLDDAEMRRTVVSSGTNLLGMVKHLTFAEHYWFAEIFAGEPAVTRVLPGEEVTEPSSDIVAAYEAACAHSREIVAASSLDDMARGTATNRRGPAAQFNLRFVLTHMIEETARHNGHADIIREQIDGATGA